MDMYFRKILFLLIFISLFACNREKKNFTVSGELNGEEGTMVYLKEMTTKELIPVDSTYTDDSGNFTLSGFTDMVRFYNLYASEDDFVVLLIHSGDEIMITGDASNLYNTYDVQGSEDSKMIHDLSVKLNNTRQEIQHLNKILNENLQNPDFLKVKADLDKAYEEIVNTHREYTFGFIRRNINSLASLMALYQQIGPHHYILDPVEDFSYYRMVDSSLNILYPESEAVRELHRQVVEIEEQKRAEEITLHRLSKGSPAPEILLPGPDGDTIPLSSLRGNYVLLDFWASWCIPSREESPNLVKNYKKYHPMGFEIYQVSLDRKRDAWLKAIRDDNLNWIHVSDLKMWNSVVVPVYHIQGIPMNFLLDPEGKIIAQNVRGERLGEVLQEIFKE